MVKLTHKKSFDGGGNFLKVSKKTFGIWAVVGVGKLVRLQKGSGCQPKGLKISQNFILVLYKLFFLISGILNNIKTHSSASQNHIPVCLELYGLLRLQNGVQCCLRDLKL